MNRWQAEYIARLDVDAGRFALAVESGATELPRLGVTDTEAAAIRGALEELRQYGGTARLLCRSAAEPSAAVCFRMQR